MLEAGTRYALLMGMNAAANTNPVARAIRFAILSLCRSAEQTEARVFSYLCERPDFEAGRYSPVLVNDVIDAMLDAGELHPSMIQDRETGRTYPTLCTV